jgi:tRNA U34 5-methylaminomethyl-2-thiouridine-forming methyltransferase MnmC
MIPNLINPIQGSDDVFVVHTLDGSDTVFSVAFGTTYHSSKGAASESRHVFIQHGLHSLAHLPRIQILEFGFGTGLNAFLSYLYARKSGKKIVYRGVEAYQIPLRVARQLNYPEYLAAKHHADVFYRMHEDPTFEIENFQFQKNTGLDKVESLSSYDIIYFDAFAPGIQPYLWEQDMFDGLFALTSQGGCLVTYCAQGEVRRRLERAGYVVHRLPGAPGKRHMLRATK